MLKRLLGISVILLLLAACSDTGENPASTPEVVIKEISVPILVPAQYANTDTFWNEPMHHVAQRCTGDFKFTHKIVDIEDVSGVSFGPGSHIAPHDHMAYWGTQNIEGSDINAAGKQFSERVQLYNPTDIFYIDLRKENRTSGEGDDIISYIEWGGYLYTCNGHQIMLGHISEPSDELNSILSKNEPECDEQICAWAFPTFILAGTPLFKSSGYASGFDFGLTLAGLTAEELQEQPGYGYSITPWRTGGSGNAVCPIEYFEEPLRSEYMKFLGDFKCGPFNQDVPGTAMGFWFPSPSPEIIPLTPAERGVDEWETIWLFQDFRDSSEYIISVGNNTFGLDYGQYSYVSSGTGLVNQQWDQIESGQTYCAELKIEDNHDDIPNDINKIILIELSEDGKQLTVEALNNNQCGDGPWEFQGGEKTFYR